MQRYELYLFIHILASIIWLGGGFMLLLQGFLADRSGDETRIKYILDQVGALANKVFIPASLTVFVMGMLMVLDGPWTFGELWIVLGLIGYAATFVTGAGILGPMGERINARIDAQGFTGQAITDTRRLLVLARLDYTVFVVLLIDMVAKPTGDDVALLAFMAILLALGTTATILRARAITGVPATAS